MSVEDKQSHQGITDQTVYISALDERADDECATAVNRGIAAAALGGVPEGLRIMIAAGIPRNTCLRVLNSKTRRRATDWR
jgi:hypothetical protein